MSMYTRRSSGPSVVAGMALIAAVGIIVAWVVMPKSPKPAVKMPPPQPLKPVAVSGIMGSDKEQLMADEKILAILRDKYHITEVKFKVKSQFEITQEDVASLDFVWHSSQLSVDVYKQNKFPFKKETVAVRSPLVLIATAELTEAMIKAKMVQKVGNTYYITTSGFAKLTSMMLGQKPWTDLGKDVPYYGPANVGSCDPPKTSSGTLWYTLVGTSANGGKLLTPENIGKIQPMLKSYYSVQGSLPSKNKVLTQSFIKTGDYPVIATFESELQEWALSYPGDVPAIKQGVRMIYPKPTIWSDHTILAITDNGVRLAKALEDPEIQRLAWERHGFRTGIAGQRNDPKLQILGVPATINSVIPIPKPEVMRILREQL